MVARSSAFQFKGKNPDIRAVGRQLNVATVLEGSVQSSGGRLRITAQLSSVADGYHVWSADLRPRLDDVFAVQDEISRAIVGALEVRVAGDPGRRLVESSTQDLEAYNLYLQGRFHLNKWRPESARKGIEYFHAGHRQRPRLRAGLRRPGGLLHLAGSLWLVCRPPGHAAGARGCQPRLATR